MRLFSTRLAVLAAIFCAATFVQEQDAGAASTAHRSGNCNFDAYRPLRFGTPIRGGHEELATKKVVPTYPPEALQKGIRGRVVIHVLIDRSGDVIKACGAGERLLANSAEEA